MEAPQMRGVEEPLLPERCAVEGGATQSEGAIETQERRYPRLHKTAGIRSLDVWAEISNARSSATSKALPALPILDSTLGSRNTLVVSIRKGSHTASRISPVCTARTTSELAESERPV